MLLCNESFASTNEREGSEIARQAIQALLAAGVRVVFVTRLFDLASGLYERGDDACLFLRAEAGTDGARPYRLGEGAPLPTSYGEDSFRRCSAVALTRTRGRAAPGRAPAARLTDRVAGGSALRLR